MNDTCGASFFRPFAGCLNYPFLPTAYAVGCILLPLRGLLFPKAGKAPLLNPVTV